MWKALALMGKRRGGIERRVRPRDSCGQKPVTHGGADGNPHQHHDGDELLQAKCL
jgi:hypothetical protein